MQSDLGSENSNTSLRNEFYPLYVELKTYVESYSGGLASLANKVSISKPTLWRWVNFKNTKAPNPYHVLSLMRYVTKKENIVDIASSSDQEVARYLKDSFPGDFQRENPAEIRSDVNELMEDFYCYLIYLVTNTKKLMSRAEVKKIVGIYSLEQLELSIEDDDLTDDLLIRLGHVADVKIDRLITASILKEEDGHLKSLCTNPKIKISTTKKHLPKLYKFFKEKNMHTGSNLMYAYQESIPRETIKKIVNIQYEAFMECYKLMESEKCEGGEIYLLTSYFDSLEYN
ncbi:MAG: hypothetical protein CME70_22555 [Halobacteriovorax sp.]|nr:hypothetical protein [Halobacteriovorax sp.]|tara:strand:- start:59565 stop:60422 length:858 start_codon:yes stop_codon:yes gene_type:complete